MASSWLLAAVPVLLLALFHGDIIVMAEDVCLVCPRDCQPVGQECWKSCCPRFDLSSLTFIAVDTSDCNRSRPEAFSTARVTGTLGGNVSLNTCSGFYLWHQGGCLKTLPPALYCPFNATRAISVRDNQISLFPSLSCLPLLGFLDLSGNSLQNIPSDAFLKNPNISEIFLDYNQISYIHPQALRDLANLYIFSVKSNKLITIDVSLFIPHHKFCHFSFTNNSLTNITNDLNWQVKDNQNYGPGMVSFDYNQFTGAGGHELFRKVGIQKIWDLGVFLGWGWDFRGNPLQCDCELYGAARWLQILKRLVIRDYFNVRCVAPPSLKGVLLYDVPLQDMVCDVNASCPDNCFCQNRPAEMTLSVNCSSGDMTSLPDVMPVDWLYDHDLTLDFNNNSLSQLHPRSYFKRTSRISLRGNNLQHILEDVPRLWTSIKQIDLMHNNLKHLPRTMQMLKPDALLIDPHTLVCSCELLEWSPAWLAGAKKDSEIRKVSCLTDDGKTLLIVSASPRDLDCERKHNVSVAYYWLIGSSSFFLFVAATLLTLFRYEVMLLIHVAKQSLGRRSMTKTNYYNLNSISKDYHVFISVSPESQEDMGWVRTNLLPRLETAGLTSYLPPRDCPLGCVEMDEVTKRLQDCAAAVIVLSPDYVTSTSALFQFRQAFSYMVARGGGPLLMLKLRPVPRRAASDPYLRAMIALRMFQCAKNGIDLVIDKIPHSLIHPVTDEEYEAMYLLQK